MADAFWAGKPGQQLTIKTNRALTGATSVLIKIKKPDGTTASWTPSSYEVSTGDIYYTTDGTTDIPDTLLGEYVGQAYVEIVGVALPPGKKFYFQVQKAIY